MDNLTRIARKITTILFAQQSLASAGFIAAATLNSIVGKELSHHANWAGVPTAVYLLAGAFAAFGWGYVFDAAGRRGGLVSGLLLGALGSGVAFIAIANSSFPMFLAGMIFMGIGNAAVQLGRFAAAEVNLPGTSRACNFKRGNWRDGWLGGRSIRGRTSGRIYQTIRGE